MFTLQLYYVKNNRDIYTKSDPLSDYMEWEYILQKIECGIFSQTKLPVYDKQQWNIWIRSSQCVKVARISKCS